MFWKVVRYRRQQSTARGRRRSFRPVLHSLEDRWLPSTFTWFQNVDGSFNDAARWHDQNGNNGVPGAGDDAIIPNGGFTVTSSVSNTVRSLNASSRLTLTAGTFTVGDAINASSLFELVIGNGAGFHVSAGMTSVTNGSESLGNFTIDAGAKLFFTGGTHHIDSGTVLNGGGAYHLSGGTLSIDANVNAPTNLFLDGGTLTGTGTFTVANGAALDFSSGSMSGQGGNTVIAPDGSLTLDGPGKKFVGNAYHLTNNGNMTWKDNGTFDFASSAVLTNNGTWTITNALRTIESAGPNATFTNSASGTLVTDPGTGTVVLDSPFNNAGAVTINSGTLDLDLGGFNSGSFDVAGGTTLQITNNTYTWGGGTAITDSGTVEIDSGTVVLSTDLEIANFTMTGGALSSANTLTVDNAFEWTGGQLTGLGTAVSNGTLTLDGPAQKQVVGGYHLVNNGAATWQGAGQLRSDSGAQITNNGTWDVIGDLSIPEFAGPDATFTNSATGTFTKDSGPGTLSIDDFFSNAGTVNINSGTLQIDNGSYNTGSIDTPAGTTLLFTRGTNTLDSGTAITDSGTVELDSGTLTLATSVEITNFTMTGGALTGANTLTVDNAFEWTGGQLTGLGTAVSNGTLTLDGPAQKQVVGGYHLVNNGAATWQGAGQLRSDSGAQITNNGTWDVIGDLSIPEFAGPDATFTNSATGTFTKDSGPGTLYIDDAFSNAGTVNINSGTLELHNGGYSTGAFNAVAGTTLTFTGGTQTLANGASLTSAGLVQVNGGTVVVDAAVSVQSFELDNGALHLTLNGVLNVAGDYTQRASGTNLIIDIGGTTAGAGYGQLNVAGTANLAGTLTVDLTNDFSPSIGDSYQILTFGSRNGDFGTKNLENLGTDRHFNPVYDPNDMTLNVVPS